jgi:sterol desaturase/sphingolipid hydroxylase (fatty acid hydroxylase superfamily)
MEHGTAAYRADFVVYGGLVIGLALFMLADAPHGMRLALAATALCGLCAWTVIEYLLHRFVLHALPPFKGWHEEHHLRPSALLCTPTLMSAALILTLVFLPAFLTAGLWAGVALTQGVTTGYFLYTVTHHAIHHWRPDSRWLKERKRSHALHHRNAKAYGRYGVTSEFWDRLFASRSA